jgi:tetratricopeptide (TPR) repeat protein
MQQQPSRIDPSQVPNWRVQKTAPNQLVERTLTPLQSDAYEIQLVKGQYLNVTAASAQLWLDLKVLFREPRPEAQDGGFAAPSRLCVSLVAPESASYWVVVGANGQTPPGTYQLQIELLQTPGPGFFERARAQQLAIELSRLYYDNRSKASLQKMSEVGEEAARLFGQLGMLKAQADMLNLVAEGWRQLGEYANALAVFERTLELSRAAGYQGKIAEALTFIGMCRYQLGDYRQAIAAYRESLPGWEQLQATGNQVLNMTGWTLMLLGESQLALSEMQQAAASFTASTTFYNRYLQISGDVKDWHFGLAFCLRGLGRIHALKGEKQPALDTLAEAIEHYKGAGDNYYEATLLNEMAEVYASLGDQGQALALCEKALRLEQHMGSRASEAQTAYLIGQLQQSAGEWDQAERSFQQTLEIRRGLSDRRGTAAALNSLGEVQLKHGATRLALSSFEEALALQREISDRYGEGLALNNLGVALATLGETARARAFLQQALALRRALGNREGEAQTLYQLARLTVQQPGQPGESLAEARRLLEAALGLTEQIRAGVLSQELRASYLGRVSDYYEFYTELLMRLHERAPQTGLHQQEALHAAEMARARSLLELLAESHTDIRADAPPDLLARERELRQQLSAKADFQMRLQTGLLPAGPHTPEQRASLARELQALNSEHQEVLARLRAASPRYAALMQPQPLTAAGIQQLLDSGTVLLEYALGTERSFLWLVTRDSVTSYVLPPRAEINAMAQRVYAALTARNQFVPGKTSAQRRARIVRADAEFAEVAGLLSQMVLAPAAGQLGHQRLLIVAQEALQFVPFAVLPEPAPSSRTAQPGGSVTRRPSVRAAWGAENTAAVARSRRRPATQSPLLVRHEIAYLPSASALALLRQQAPQRRSGLKEVAVLADPVFSQDDARLHGAPPSPGPSAKAALPSAHFTELRQALRDVGAAESAILGINRLPGTRWEAEHITSLVAPNQQMHALDFAANRGLATSAALKQYRIVHFATHALINTTHPGLSGLVLSLVDEQGRPQDGFLPAAEIFNLNFSARLVVLSACQTGLGKTVRGEGLVGMVQSFLYAGASSVAVSLWSQQDRTTAELMKLMYRRLLGRPKRAPAAALRAAQLEMLNSGRWPSPYFWAGFTVQGEYR